VSDRNIGTYIGNLSSGPDRLRDRSQLCVSVAFRNHSGTIAAASVPKLGHVWIQRASLWIQSVAFFFTPATWASLAENSITVPANTLFETWYTTAESAQYGGAFTYTQRFTLPVPATAIGGIGVTLTNTIGTSTEVTSP
jgi:hypothetical protein